MLTHSAGSGLAMSVEGTEGGVEIVCKRVEEDVVVVVVTMVLASNAGLE